MEFAETKVQQILINTIYGGERLIVHQYISE